jgi:hypothetical protein
VAQKRIVAVALAVVAAACGSSTSSPGLAAQSVSVNITPAQATVAPGSTQSFSATVTGTANTAVSWSVLEGAVGGTIDMTGTYSAPGASGTYHVVATSQAVTSSNAVATVTVAGTPTVVVTISPKTASLAVGAVEQFTAVVTGTSTTSVTWSVQESSACGTISSAGLYTAPSAAATCHVVATSTVDATKSDVATITVGSTAVTVAVSPSSAAVDGCGTLNLAATVGGSSNTAVTWSVEEGAAGGSITSAGVYTAPTTSGVYHAVATSQADATVSAMATLTVTNKVLSVAVSPATISLAAGGSAEFTATVTTSCGPVVTTQVVTAPAR